MAYNFYGQCAEDTYQGKSTFSSSLLSCTNSDALKLEYGGYKTYIINRKEKVKSELENRITSLKAKLLSVKANKTRNKKDLWEIEKELRMHKGFSTILRIFFYKNKNTQKIYIKPYIIWKLNKFSFH